MPLPEAQITRYQRFLRETQGLQFADYDALWRWSVSDAARTPTAWIGSWIWRAGAE